MRRIIPFIFILLMACSNKKSSSDRVLKIPPNFNVLLENCEIVSPENYARPLQITHFFNGDCSYCVVQLRKWQEFIELYNHFNLDFIFLTTTNNPYYLNQYLVEKLQFNVQVFNIDKHEFTELNSITDDQSTYTFLTYNNKIICEGNPLIDDRVLSLYEELLLEYSE